MSDPSHYHLSTYREKLLEHLFLGELLKHLWFRGFKDVDVLRPDIDRGYDIVIRCNSITRHIQLKSSRDGGRTARQKVNLRLADVTGGCVIWTIFNEKTLELGPFLWFGNDPGKKLPDISKYDIAKHSKADSTGKKNERPMIRVIPKGKFKKFIIIDDIIDKLFGVAQAVS